MYYSQYDQDKFLEERVFCGYKDGVFVDVGAYDGKHINNTLYFEETNNWSGINIEPIREIYDKLCSNRPKGINLNFAISENEGICNFIRNKGYSEMLSGLQNNYDERHFERLKKENNLSGGITEIIQVPTLKLSTILEKYGVTHVNYLSIDVEGAEYSVIKSIDFDKVLIDVIQFENNFEDKSKPIIEYLEKLGYEMLLKSHDVIMINSKSMFKNQFVKDLHK